MKAASNLICATTIVRDEEENLPGLVASLTGVADTLVVVDTGSSDRTRDVARELGAVLVEDAWDDDFARSRNVSLRAAEQTGARYLLIVDADDRIEDGDELRRFVESEPPGDAFKVVVDSVLHGDAGTVHEAIRQLRLVRADVGLRYKHPVHHTPLVEGLEVGVAPGRIRHLGYSTPELRRRKAKRVLRMLARMPDDHPHRLHHEARAAAALLRHDLVREAAEKLERLLGCCPPDVALLYTTSALQEGKPHDAVRVLTATLAEFPHNPDVFFGLMTAAGMGYAGAALSARRAGPLDFPVVTLDRMPRVLRALVEIGLLQPGVLDLPLSDDSRPSSTSHAPAVPPRRASQPETGS